MNEDELMLLFKAKEMVKKNPKLFGHLITACTQGIEEEIDIHKERAMDFETISVAYMTMMSTKRVTKSMREWADTLIKDKMLRWEGKTCMNFSKEIESIKDGEL